MQAKNLIWQLPLETLLQKSQSKCESGQVEGSFLIRNMYLDLKFYNELVGLSVLSWIKSKARHQVQKKCSKVWPWTFVKQTNFQPLNDRSLVKGLFKKNENIQT